MLQKDKTARDRFTLSLGGMRAINSSAIVPAIAHDRMHQHRNDRVRDAGSHKWRFWIPRRFRVA